MNLYLIGYRGSGKTTVARRLAAKLDREVVDTDLLIETTSGRTISEIFATEGEAEFRRLETATIHAFDANADLIISLGGGAPLAAINRNWLAEHGKTAWLTASPVVLWDRINADPNSQSQRPALTDQAGLAEVEAVLAARTPIYAECSDYTIDVSQMSPEQIADAIVTWWQSVDRI